MKIDLYTKGILTVIALSLVVMAFKDVSPVNEAHAQSNKVVKMAICTSDGERCASIFRERRRNYLAMWNGGR
jgi:hypothetical protein